MAADWTDEEIERLKDNYHKLGGSGCVPLFPDKTITQIYTRAKGLQLKVDPETRKRNVSSENSRRHAAKRTFVDAAIKGGNYHDNGPVPIAEYCGVDVAYVSKRASLLGIKCDQAIVGKKRTGKWSKRKTIRDKMETRLSETEQLALFKPWGNREREMREPWPL